MPGLNLSSWRPETDERSRILDALYTQITRRIHPGLMRASLDEGAPLGAGGLGLDADEKDRLLDELEAAWRVALDRSVLMKPKATIGDLVDALAQGTSNS
ncbi:MAG: hypothetical protein HYV07_25385 [Deltaproteobacteria bacterium]|nr:hypothetical protein [Deltaproteobacteria bacterium]